MLKYLGKLFKKWGNTLDPEEKKVIEIKTDQLFATVCKDCKRVIDYDSKESKDEIDESKDTDDIDDDSSHHTSYPVIYFNREDEYPTEFSLYEILEDDNGEISVVFASDNSKSAKKTKSGNYSLVTTDGRVVTVRRHTILNIVKTHKETAGHRYYRKPN